jgi:hypothetical protein
MLVSAAEMPVSPKPSRTNPTRRIARIAMKNSLNTYTSPESIIHHEVILVGFIGE